jgi:hypothetical protein
MARRQPHLATLSLGLVLASGSLGSLHARPRCLESSPAAPARVRAITPLADRALRDGLRRSSTLAALVERIDRSDGIVYIQDGVLRPQMGSRLRGALSHRVVLGPGFRLLHIIVMAAADDAMIVTIAHELRHAIEVIETPEAVDTASVGLLYERIGFRTRAGVYETNAADETGERVQAELSRCRP